MALVGNLKDLKLHSLIQLNCMERNTAKLTIENAGKYGFVYFEDGQVVHAEFEPEIGEKAIAALLSLYSGNFKVVSGIRAPAKTIHKHWNNLLLDSLNELDNTDVNKEHQFDHMFDRLFTVKDMQMVMVIDKEGKVAACSSDVKDKKNYLFAFSQLEAEKIGEVFTRQIPEFISIAASPHKYIFTSYNQFYVVMMMDIKVKMDVVLPLLKQALS